MKFKLDVEIRGNTIFDIIKNVKELRTELQLGKDVFTSKRLDYCLKIIEEPVNNTQRVEVIDGKKYLIVESKLNRM